MYSNTLHARHFLVQKVELEARAEGAALTRAEHYTLCRGIGCSGECDDQALERAFAAETGPVDFEARVSGLLKSAYEHDLKRSTGARGVWQEKMRSAGSGCLVARLAGEAVGHKLGLRALG